MTPERLRIIPTTRQKARKARTKYNPLCKVPHLPNVALQCEASITDSLLTRNDRWHAHR